MTKEHRLVSNHSYRKNVRQIIAYPDSALLISQTYSLTLREERRLRAFENRVLRRLFGCKRDEVTGEWRKPHNEDLHDL
jgi:hypothetical protein